MPPALETRVIVTWDSGERTVVMSGKLDARSAHYPWIIWAQFALNQVPYDYRPGKDTELSVRVTSKITPEWRKTLGRGVSALLCPSWDGWATMAVTTPRKLAAEKWRVVPA